MLNPRLPAFAAEAAARVPESNGAGSTPAPPRDCGSPGGPSNSQAPLLAFDADRVRGLAALRPDLPAWLGAALGRAIAPDPAERFADMAEFAHEFEAGPLYAPPPVRRPLTLYERASVRFWQVVAGLLALALAASLCRS